jgi:hypothetical protein
MKNIYNKGKYRNREWAKHLRPFLKKVGNRKWRIEAKYQIQTDLLIDYQSEQEIEKIVKRIPRKQKKKVKVKITTTEFNGQISSTTRKFHSLKAMKNSLARNNVLRHYIYDEN